MIKKAEAPLPAYYRLQVSIQNEIESGRRKPGEIIPTERVLAETHKVSIGTVKKALLNLVFEGYLYRVQGKGTFVAGTTLRRESLRYYRLLKHFDDVEADLKVKFLKIDEMHCFEPVAQYLNLSPRQKLYEIKRVFLSEKKPVVYTVSYLPHKMFKKLEDLPKTLFEKMTLYKVLEQNHGLPTIYNHELFQIVPADAEVAGILKIEEQTPIFFIEMLSFTYKDKPYEYRQAFCHSGQRKLFREI
jgi:DNA-binding GntR family transcriptional regulator